MGLEGVKLQFEVSEVPESDCLVGGPRGQDELGVGIKRKAVDLGRVSIHLPKNKNK